MTSPLPHTRTDAGSQPERRESNDPGHAVCDSAMVNRTHRVVRERANAIQARRSRFQSILVPLLVSSALLMILCFAVWTVLDQYDSTPSGIPDSSNQMLVLILWFLPVSAAILATVLLRRAAACTDSETTR